MVTENDIGDLVYFFNKNNSDNLINKGVLVDVFIGFKTKYCIIKIKHIYSYYEILVSCNQVFKKKHQFMKHVFKESNLTLLKETIRCIKEI